MLLQLGSVGTVLVINLLIAAVVGYVIYRDAQGRNTNSPLLWGLALAGASFFLSLVGTILALIIYYLVVIRN